MQPLVLLTLGLALLAPLLGRLVGWRLARRRWVELGSARAVMPSPPQEETPLVKELGARFEARVSAAASRIHQKLLSSDPKGITAEGLAVELSLPPEVTAAALERLRAQASCHLRVTRSGKLLHDFTPSSLRTIKSAGQLPFITRVTLWLAALLANLGAIWPLVLSLMGASLALLGLWSESDDAWLIAAGVIICVPLAFALVIAGGVLVGALLSPWSKTPHLGNALAEFSNGGKRKKGNKKERKANWQEEVKESDAFGASEIARFVINSVLFVDLPLLVATLLFRMFGVSASSFLLGLLIVVIVVGIIAAVIAFGPEILQLGEAIEAVPFIIVGLLLATALSSLVGIVFWVIGLWRSIAQEPPSVMSPGKWVQRPQKTDTLSVLVPTNDLVIRLSRALQRALERKRPIDPGMPARLYTAAQERGGRLAAFEITLLEGLDPEEAVSVGASLSAHAGGSLEVSEEGELYFILPDAGPQREPRDAYEEFFGRNQSGGRVAPLGMPVNLIGVTLADIEGMERLCAGTAMMLATLWASYAGLGSYLFEGAWAAPAWTLPAAAGLLVGVFMLTGALRYVARVEARSGFLRDVRRETFAEIQKAVKENRRLLKASELAQTLSSLSKKAWPSLTQEEVLQEVEAACDDLRLELSPEALAKDPEETRPYALAPLKERLEAMKSPAPKALEKNEEVVFDTSSLIRAR